MTNKMPVAGKRYRAIKKSPYTSVGDEIEIINISGVKFYGFLKTENEISFKYEHEFFRGIGRFRYDKENFFDYFEEIPSEKQEEKLCSICRGTGEGNCLTSMPPQWQKCLICNGTGELTPITKKLDAEWERPKSQLSDEVLEAIEELREYLEQAKSSEKHVKVGEAWPNMVIYGSQNLLIALDKQKDCSSERKPQCTMTLQTPDDPSLGFNSPTWSDVKEKPASIWKPVSEICDRNYIFKVQILFKTSSGDIAFGVIQGKNFYCDNGSPYNLANPEGLEFVTFADFIQDTERTKSELAELKAKVEKLMEGK